jgi:hypothetical protein
MNNVFKTNELNVSIMKKYLKRTQQGAHYSAGAMETGDHFKNGANPKSQTSRGNNYTKTSNESK